LHGYLHVVISIVDIATTTYCVDTWACFEIDTASTGVNFTGGK